MNNQLVMDNYLRLLKSTVEVYVHGTLESSNEDVRNDMKENLNETLTSQANTYDLMTKNGLIFFTSKFIPLSSIISLFKHSSSVSFFSTCPPIN